MGRRVRGARACWACNGRASWGKTSECPVAAEGWGGLRARGPTPHCGRHLGHTLRPTQTLLALRRTLNCKPARSLRTRLALTHKANADCGFGLKFCARTYTAHTSPIALVLREMRIEHSIKEKATSEQESQLQVDWDENIC